ncbi:MAG: peroxiredoxin [Terracoccus sp.]
MTADRTVLSVGDSAPELDLQNQDGQTRSLAQLRGTAVIVYFFPKAFTPGCTKEVCDFRDSRSDLERAGYTVFGVSADSPQTLREFADANGVGHDLLSDPDHGAAKRWGAFGDKVVNGQSMVGPLRSTFVVDAEGDLTSVEYSLDANTHVSALRADLGV